MATTLTTSKPLPWVQHHYIDANFEMLPHIGHYPIWQAAAPLLAWLLQIRNHSLPLDMVALRLTLSKEVTHFTIKAEKMGIMESQINAMRYLLCAVMDEFILNQQLQNEASWQQENDWSQHCLITLFYQEAWGGENFFVILQQLMENPALNSPLLELALLCLNLGYLGKYRMESQGQEKLALLREQVFCLLKQQQMVVGWEFNLPSPPIKSKKTRRFFWLKLCITLLVFIALGSSGWFFTNQYLNNFSTTANQLVAQINS